MTSGTSGGRSSPRQFLITHQDFYIFRQTNTWSMNVGTRSSVMYLKWTDGTEPEMKFGDFLETSLYLNRNKDRDV